MEKEVENEKKQENMKIKQQSKQLKSAWNESVDANATLVIIGACESLPGCLYGIQLLRI